MSASEEAPRISTRDGIIKQENDDGTEGGDVAIKEERQSYSDNEINADTKKSIKIDSELEDSDHELGDDEEDIKKSLNDENDSEGIDSRQSAIGKSVSRPSSIRKSSIGDPSVRESSFKDPSMRQSSFKDPSMRQSSFKDPSMRQSSVRDPSMRQSSVRDPSMRQSSFKDPSMRQSSFKDPSLRQSSVKDPFMRQSSFKDPSMRQSSVRDSLTRQSSATPISMRKTMKASQLKLSEEEGSPIPSERDSERISKKSYSEESYENNTSPRKSSIGTASSSLKSPQESSLRLSQGTLSKSPEQLSYSQRTTLEKASWKESLKSSLKSSGMTDVESNEDAFVDYDEIDTEEINDEGEKNDDDYEEEEDFYGGEGEGDNDAEIDLQDRDDEFSDPGSGINFVDDLMEVEEKSDLKRTGHRLLNFARFMLGPTMADIVLDIIEYSYMIFGSKCLEATFEDMENDIKKIKEYPTVGSNRENSTRKSTLRTKTLSRSKSDSMSVQPASISIRSSSIRETSSSAGKQFSFAGSRKISSGYKSRTDDECEDMCEINRTRSSRSRRSESLGSKMKTLTGSENQGIFESQSGSRRSGSRSKSSSMGEESRNMPEESSQSRLGRKSSLRSRTLSREGGSKFKSERRSTDYRSQALSRGESKLKSEFNMPESESQNESEFMSENRSFSESPLKSIGSYNEGSQSSDVGKKSQASGDKHKGKVTFMPEANERGETLGDEDDEDYEQSLQ